ncbi:MAG TPA: TssQ family T6SS-associated lipoprotein [Burkholderiales bacterium]|nr:TssQ family T6SS-associated lipoprotein [Burkholderiales bacterium]
MIRSLVLFLAFALAGCESEPVRKVQEFFQPTKAQQTLSVGLKQYEEGQYAESMKSLQSAIHLGLDGRDRVNAHKHLAFIHCASSRERPCRDEFRKALAVDPGMDLEPEEAGHPVWGPIFRSVKAGR